MSLTKEQIIESLEKMSVLDLNDLVKSLEERFGVTAMAPVMAGAGGGAEEKKEAAEEKNTFDVILKSFGDQKIKVIKAVREVTTLGLKEAKDLVESAPKTIKEDVTKEESEEIKKKLEEQGATVEIK